ncbi:MAG: UDP-N-acetylmuramoyl-tripeptide--D-alanyl-D-alanine ligase [Clostridia bacterium]|nr:UDP-N-acetylmuramoyl-tripeptide--D-alanyl-D-alanine ligase [Clostridia bacterium]
MIRLTAEELRGFLNAEEEGFARGGGDFCITSVCTDTRKITKDCLFVPIVGARFDGHDFIDEAFKLGAAGALSARPGESREKVISVPDTLDALCRLSAAYKASLNIKTVAITGSVGKTTTKEMTAAAISAGLRTQKTAGNFNNNIGLPLTLLTVSHEHEAAVVEMGMSAAGEISALTKLAKPDLAIITNIGTSHIEYLGSQENICKAKFEILDGMEKGSVIILNGDDPFLVNRPETEGFKPFYYGIRNPVADVRAENIREEARGVAFTAVYPGGSVEVCCGMAGEHIVYDALAALSAAITVGIRPELAAKSISEVLPEGMRQRVCTMGDVEVIMDCYNANPDSMRAALKVLAARSGRRIALLGDMLELGAYSETAHTELGKTAAQSADIIVAVGRFADCVLAGAKNAGKAREFVFTPERSNASDLLYGILRPGDTVLVKGSRGMKMEDIMADCEQKMKHGTV